MSTHGPIKLAAVNVSMLNDRYKHIYKFASDNYKWSWSFVPKAGEDGLGFISLCYIGDTASEFNLGAEIKIGNKDGRMVADKMYFFSNISPTLNLSFRVQDYLEDNACEFDASVKFDRVEMVDFRSLGLIPKPWVELLEDTMAIDNSLGMVLDSSRDRENKLRIFTIIGQLLHYLSTIHLSKLKRQDCISMFNLRNELGNELGDKCDWLDKLLRSVMNLFFISVRLNDLQGQALRIREGERAGLGYRGMPEIKSSIESLNDSYKSKQIEMRSNQYLVKISKTFNRFKKA